MLSMQAAHLAGGVYLRPDRPAALLQYLLAVFLPAPGDRAFLSLPAGAPVDLRASCFCHRCPVRLYRVNQAEDGRIAVVVACHSSLAVFVEEDLLDHGLLLLPAAARLDGDVL